MVFYVLAVLVEYAIAFGLALLLNAEIRARKFFRVVFLLPLHAVAGRGELDDRQVDDGIPLRPGRRRWRACSAGTTRPSSPTPWIARFSIMVHGCLDLHPLHDDHAARRPAGDAEGGAGSGRVDGANAWQTFWQVTFPLMLPVSVTAIILRIIFKLKLADIVINVTSGGPGGATDTVSSFIYREYRDRSNVGYGTMLAMVYLVIIIVFVTLLLKLASRCMQSDDLMAIAT